MSEGSRHSLSASFFSLGGPPLSTFLHLYAYLSVWMSLCAAGPRIHCGLHRENGDVSKINRACDSCDREATYGPANGQRERCRVHKLDTDDYKVTSTPFISDNAGASDERCSLCIVVVDVPDSRFRFRGRFVIVVSRPLGAQRVAKRRDVRITGSLPLSSSFSFSLPPPEFNISPVPDF